MIAHSETHDSQSNKSTKQGNSVPHAEATLDKFSCTYIDDTDRHGEMHITSTHAVFHAEDREKEPIVARLSEVAVVENKVSRVLSDGLTLIMGDGTRHEFAFIVNGADRAFKMISQLYSTHKGPAANHSPSTLALRGIPVSGPPIFPATNNATYLANLPVIGSLMEFDELVPTVHGSAFSNPSVFLDNPVSEPYRYPPGYTLIDVFRAVYDNDAPTLTQYHLSLRETDLTLEPWQPPNATDKANRLPLGGQRVYRCKSIIRALFVENRHPYEEFQRYGFCMIDSTPHLIFHTSGQVSGAMFADTFRVETLCVYRQEVDPSTKKPVVTSCMHLHIQFVKFCFLKGKIRSSALEELKEGTEKLNELTRINLISQRS